jgi:hypothetical protein
VACQMAWLRRKHGHQPFQLDFILNVVKLNFYDFPA